MVYTPNRDGSVNAGPFPKGMNNKQADHDLPEGCVRNAVNVDFTNSGRARCRKGITKVYSGIGIKSGFKRYFVEGTDLCYLNSDDTRTVLCSGITGTDFTFCYFLGSTYFSDGIVNKKLTGTSIRNWGLSIPETPTVVRTSGSCTPGTYKVAYSWVDSDGVMSGCSNVLDYVLGSTGGLVFSNLPTLPEDAESLRIFLSTPNGSEMYHVADTTASSYTLLTLGYDTGSVAERVFSSPPPAASIIRFYKSRCYIVDTSGVVWYSEPFSFDHFSLASGYLVFPSEVTVMEPVESGIYFATDTETFFYGGTPENGFDVTKVFNYGAIKGSGTKTPDNNAIWLSKRGIVEGDKSGSCINKQEENVATETGTSGALLVREYSGIRQAIAVINDPTTSKLAATSFIEAEIIRRT